MKESEIRPQALFNRYLELVQAEAQELTAQAHEFIAVSCPGCGGSEGVPDFVKFGFQYCLCAQCGSLYVSPRPEATRVAAYYREASSVIFWWTHFFRETAEAGREKIFRPRAVFIARVVRDRSSVGCCRLVDIGSGYGIFLDEIQRLELFDRVTGLEPAPQLAALCRERGFDIVEKQAEELADGEVDADVATAFEVLEHVFGPLAFLGGAWRVLRPGGLLTFTTLTVTGFDIQVLGEQPKSVSPPQHINLLSVDGLRQLVARAGFQLEELSIPGHLDVDIVMNMAAESDSVVLAPFVRTLLGQPPATREALQVFLSDHNLSSHVRVIARRP